MGVLLPEEGYNYLSKFPSLPKYPFLMSILPPEEGGGYLIEFPDLPGCMSDGDTIEETIENGKDAVFCWIESTKEFGDKIPQPVSANGFSPAPEQQSSQTELPPIDKEVTAISGLQYIKDYINEEQHKWLLERIDKDQWLDDLKRRVQHYGFKYDYKARKVNLDMRIGELPEWLKKLSQKLYQDGHMSEVADQVIINEYEPGQGISSHIDCEPCFKDTIISLSLGSGCVMNFTNKSDRTKKIPVWLAPRSLVVLSGEARYEWLHGIAARKWDEWDGHKYERQRRVSLTFRKVIIKNYRKKGH